MKEKLWDPLVLDKVLDNWNENPFTEVKLLDFTTPEYDDYWAGNYENADKLNFDCPAGFEEIAQGYWYGMEDGCVCAGDYGGKILDGFNKRENKKYKPISNK